MKKITCFFISIIGLLSYGKAQSTFGISAGITSALISAKADGVTENSDAKIGFIGGITASTAIAKRWIFRPELNFAQKGGTINFDQEGTKVNATLNYIELPLNVVYSPKGKFFFGAGPSLAYGVSGNYKVTGQYSGSTSVKFGSDSNSDFKPFEFGVNLLVGWQLNSGVFFTINYNAGISNISTTSGETDNNSYLGLKIGYMFKNKKK
jgi:hypothetical protein